MLHKKLILPVIGVSLLGATLLTSAAAFAQDANTTQKTIVQKIAEKFGLNQTDVQAVFDADRTERMQGMRTRYEQKLTDDVTAGKITEAQKQLILQKQTELENVREQNRAAHQNLAPEERKVQMEAKQKELQEWATQNGIPEEYLRFGMKGGMGMGMKGFGMRNGNTQTVPVE